MDIAHAAVLLKLLMSEFSSSLMYICYVGVDVNEFTAQKV
jgi:hypothetical protein